MRLALLLVLGLSVAALAQTPEPARTSLNIHPQSHWTTPQQATPSAGPMLIVSVPNTGGLSDLPALQGRREEQPPDHSRNGVYNQPFLPVVQIP